MPEIPKIVSVDDHVIEPPDVWQDRLPASYKEIGPRLDRRKVKNMKFVGGVFSYEEAAADEDGTWCDWWLIEDLQYPLTRLSAAFRRSGATGTAAWADGSGAAELPNADALRHAVEAAGGACAE